jgi:arabinan endo-1,5-alpha-L-arabinosidase
MSKKITLLVLLFLFALINPLSKAGEGVLDGMPDPTMIEGDDGRFYVFATGKGLPIYRSGDLINWEFIDRVFDKPVPDWAKETLPQTEGIWAPDIVKLNRKYYAYYSVSSFGSQRSVTGVAVNNTLDPASPDYKWTDLGMVVESFPGKDDFNAIDIAVFQDQDGRAHAIWGSHWGGLKYAEINPETGKFLEQADRYPTVAARHTGVRAIEAPFLFRRGENYYLFVSFDSCCQGAESTYKIMVGRSKNPEGPYLDFHDRPMTQGGGTLVLSNHDNWRGTGHNSAIENAKGDFIVHHTYDTCNLDKHRILQIRPMYWTEDDWPVAGQPINEKNPPRSNPGRFTAAQIVGSWRISMDYGQERIVDLIPGGRIANQRHASWSVSENRITMTWPDDDDATWIDRCIIEPSGKSFIGRNQLGAVIRGVKICH